MPQDSGWKDVDAQDGWQDVPQDKTAETLSLVGSPKAPLPPALQGGPISGNPGGFLRKTYENATPKSRAEIANVGIPALKGIAATGAVALPFGQAIEAPLATIGSIAGGYLGQKGGGVVGRDVGGVFGPEGREVGDVAGRMLGGIGGGIYGGMEAEPLLDRFHVPVPDSLRAIPNAELDRGAFMNRGYKNIGEPAELGSPENPGWVTKIPDRMPRIAPPMPELGSPENPGWVAPLPNRMPTVAPPTPELGSPENPGWVVPLPGRMPKAEAPLGEISSPFSGGTSTAIGEISNLEDQALPASQGGAQTTTGPTANIEVASKGAKTPEAEGIKGSVAKPSGRLVLTPSEAQSEEQMQQLATKRASQHGMLYAAGMRPAGGGRVPMTATGTMTPEGPTPRAVIVFDEEGKPLGRIGVP